MNRFKFRLWDKKHNKMILPEEGSSFRFYLNVAGEVVVGIYDITSDIEVMQFTGLLDKNGKEIYEGDIVEGFGGEKYKVIWEDNWSRFVFENFDEEDYSYDPADNENCSQHDLEVIGNIYENPELLEVK